MSNHVKWPKIYAFHQVKKTLEAREEWALTGGESFKMPTVTYRAKVKLDGTNAAIRVRADGTWTAQSRSRDIVPGDDNYGFAKWAEGRDFGRLANRAGDVVLYGEWCGKGIQKRTAVATLDPMWCVFGMRLPRDGGLVASPDMLADVVPVGVHVLPWWGPAVEINFDDDAQTDIGLAIVNSLVEEVERCDPWVRSQFMVEGMGEGLVFYPWFDFLAEKDVELMLKAKGEKHTQVRPAKREPVASETLVAFVAQFVTEARCEQALQEGCAGVAEMSQTGNFLKWINQDILAESETELEASAMKWKDVQSAVTRTAKQWWLAEVAK